MLVSSSSQTDWSDRLLGPSGFALLALLTLIFRSWLAVSLPMSGDEAYFIWWGQWPDWGFYDHPPMIGWWLAVLLKVSSSEWWLRLPIVLQPILLGMAIATVLKPHGQRLAWGAASLTLLAPANLWNVFITTDTPLIYFSVISGLGWLLARRAEDNHTSPWRWYVIAGLGLAGAVLSKYFAVLLGFAFLVDTLLKPSKGKFAGLLLTYALVLPGVALMAWWNAGHCWANIMFNVYNRHQQGNSGLSWQSPLLYGGMMLYLLTPLCLWYLQRQRHALTSLASSNEGRALLLIAGVPLAVFVPLSLVRTVGLHWVLSFVPFVLMAMVLAIKPDQLRRALRFFSGFAVLHVVLALGLASQPLERWQHNSAYSSAVLTFAAPQVLAELEPYSDHVWMMDGYSNAVTLGYNTYARSKNGEPRYIGVFGPGSSHARHDDILTDFRALDGRNIAVLRKTPPSEAEYQPYFESVEYREFTVRGARFYLVLGQGFVYPAYRDGILANSRDQFYRIPAALPQTACYFCDRYFSGQPCQR